jgi:hypothetical protein
MEDMLPRQSPRLDSMVGEITTPTLNLAVASLMPSFVVQYLTRVSTVVNRPLEVREQRRAKIFW